MLGDVGDPQLVGTQPVELAVHQIFGRDHAFKPLGGEVTLIKVAPPVDRNTWTTAPALGAKLSRTTSCTPLARAGHLRIIRREGREVFPLCATVRRTQWPAIWQYLGRVCGPPQRVAASVPLTSPDDVTGNERRQRDSGSQQE
jgi:hypothetical protein